MMSLLRWTKVSKDRKPSAADVRDQISEVVNESKDSTDDKDQESAVAPVPVPEAVQKNLEVEVEAEVEEEQGIHPVLETQECVKTPLNPMLLPITLKKMMSYLDKNGLHKCRTVCSMWNTFALEQLRKVPQLMTTSSKDFSVWNRLTKTRFDPLPFTGISIDAPLNKSVRKFLKKTGVEITQMQFVMHQPRRVLYFFKKELNTIVDLRKIVKHTPHVKEITLTNIFKNSCVVVVRY